MDTVLFNKFIYCTCLYKDPSTAFPPPIILKSRLKQCIQPAISRLVDTNGSEERALIRLQQFEKLLQSDNNDG